MSLREVFHQLPTKMRTFECYPPVNEAKRVDSLNGEHALRNVESCHILREGVILDQHRHEIPSRQELHDQIEIRRVLEGVVELDDPWRVGFCEDIALCAYVCKLKQGSVRTLINMVESSTPDPSSTSRPF